MQQPLEKTSYIVGVWNDITEHKKADEAIRTSAQKWQATFNAIGDAVCIMDNEDVILQCNKAMTVLFSKPLQKIVGSTHLEVVHYAAEPVKACPVARMRETRQREVQEFQMGSRWFTVVADPVLDENGGLAGCVHIMSDTTEHKKLEAQLRHAQKMEAIGTLAGGIAHDFNNILNVIIGYGSMVHDSLEAGSNSKEQMNEILTAAERASTLTKRLLVFSRKQVVEVKPVNINELVLGLQKMLVRIITESIDFKLGLADRPIMVLADTGQIEQVLMNLASNAKDAMPEGGRLTIGTEIQELDEEYVAVYGYGKPGRYALITVADTGKGMDEKTKEKIFEPFFTTKGIGEGTGLGLAITYGIIKQHSGYIKVYSELGKGTEFKIYLPLHEDAASLGKKTEAAAFVKGGNETILIAEDDASLRKLSKVLLQSHGYKVITAEDGEDAITKFMENREKISLAVLDMIMPKRNGKEVGEAIRKVKTGTKILFASGYTMDIIKTRELTDAGFDFILKPISPRDLLGK